MFRIRAAERESKKITINVNGYDKEVLNMSFMSYETLCEIAGIPSIYNPSATYSIRLSKDEFKEGTAYKGKQVPVAEGAIYNVCITSAA